MTPAWFKYAACYGRDQHYWYPFDDDRNPYAWGKRHPEPIRTWIRMGLTICATCDVRQECLDYAIDNGETRGIWGGMTPPQRTRERNARVELAGRRRLGLVS